MIKKNKQKLLISSIIILLPIIVGLITWNSLPQQMAVHWDANGVPNGWRSRSFSVFAIPLFMLAVHWICIIGTSLDPKNKNQTLKVFGLIFWICPIVSLFVGTIIYATAFGMDFGVNTIGNLFVGLIFVAVGNYLPKCKQNYTIGIKIVWTLDNEENWNATHRFGGKVWVIGGLLIMLCAFLPKAVTSYALVALAVLMVLIPVVYSYLYYRRQKED